MKACLNMLADELRAAGLPGDCCSDGRVDFADGSCWRPGQEPRNAQERTAAAVVAAHDPSPTRAEKLRAAGISEREAALALVAFDGDGAPGWALEVVASIASAARKALGLVLLAVLFVSGCVPIRDDGAAAAPRYELPSALARALPVLEAGMPLLQDELARHAKERDGTPLGALAGAGGGVLAIAATIFGLKTRARNQELRAVAIEGDADAADIANDRDATKELLGITMAALEHAAPEVRKKARDAARRKQLSPRLERMIAEGWVPDLDQKEGHRG